jgi:hypothetical protein
MSEYVVHFTKDTSDGQDAYHNMLSILYDGCLRAGEGVFGATRWMTPRWPRAADLHRCVCLSEIPLDQLNRLVERRSSYGIGFRKSFVAAQSGVRVWYIDKDEPGGAAIRRAITDAAEAAERADNPDDPVFSLTPFVDFIGHYMAGPYEFDWEREWRVRGELRFSPDDVPFLFIPAEFHEAARRFFADAVSEHDGPGYFCHYVDPLWPDDQIQGALATMPPPPEIHPPRDFFF